MPLTPSCEFAGIGAYQSAIGAISGVLWELWNPVTETWYLPFIQPPGCCAGAGNCRAKCLVCVGPGAEEVVSGELICVNPNLVTCGGNPDSEDFYCGLSACVPTTVWGDIQVKDTRTPIGSGSVRVYRRHHTDDAMTAAKVASGWDALFDTWKTNPNSRTWKACDYFILGERGSAMDGWASLSPANVSGDVPFTLAELSAGVPFVLPASCGFYGVFADGTHTMVATGYSLTEVARYGETTLVSIRNDLFSDDVLAAFLELVELLGHEVQTLSDANNPANWRWFPSFAERIFSTVTFTFGPWSFYDFTDARWNRSHYLLGGGIARFRKVLLNSPATCEDYQASTSWPAGTVPFRHDRLKLNLEIGGCTEDPAWCNTCMTQEQSENNNYLFPPSSGLLAVVPVRSPQAPSAPSLPPIGTESQYAWQNGGYLPASWEWL